MSSGAAPLQPDPQSGRRFAFRYLVTVACSAGGTLLLYLVFLLMLNATGNLPPPAITNNVCLDEKLEFLRNNPTIKPETLVVGSSVAWRNFSGAELPSQSVDARPLNGGFCGLHANQIGFSTRYLLHRYQTVRDVVVILAPQDVETCKVRRAVFDTADVDAYLSGKTWPYTYYLRYFDPVSLVRNALTIARQRSGYDAFDSVMLDPFGGSPLITTLSKRSQYGAYPGSDPACFRSLTALAQFVEGSGRRFLVVISPRDPTWRTNFDPQDIVGSNFRRSIASATAGTGGKVWDANHDLDMPTADFIDAVHLRSTGARLFSANLARVLRDSLAEKS
jgi:hypothetical protein